MSCPHPEDEEEIVLRWQIDLHTSSAAVIPDLPKYAKVMDQITPNFFLIAIIPVVA